ncbi:MAG: hypothetical protein JXA11_08855 [Phycisphaerae bacterium]|nr:hypothetical protein [Phycisphaerae bacterium]
MAENAKSSDGSSTTGVIVTCLYLVAGLAAAAGILISVAWILQTPRDERGALQVWAYAAGSFMSGLIAACGLWAAAWLIRQREESAFAQRRMLRVLMNLNRKDEDALEIAPAAQPVGDMPQSAEGDMMPQLLRQLSELNANVLLTEDERREKRRKAISKQADDLSRDIESALLDRRFDDAGELVHRLRDIVPDHERLGVFHQQVEAGQEEQVRELISGQVKHAGDLMSVSKFEEARQVAEHLRRSYPHSREADELLSRVQREAATFHAEKRHRLYAVIQENSQARQWKQALAGAHKLLETYAKSEEAEKIRSMMPTLVDNARIQEVREIRDRIVDLMERHRYAEAVQLAHQVVDNYPETTAAEELRVQIPRLQELAYVRKNNKP